MQWFFLLVGIIAQTLSSTLMKLSDGFSNLWLSVFAFIFWGISISVFIFALKDLDLTYAYAVFAGVGMVLISIVGFVYFKEPVTLLKVVSICLVTAGVVGLSL